MKTDKSTNEESAANLTDEEVLTEEKGIEERDISPKELLKFAKLILLSLVVLFVLASLSELILPGNAVFEISKTVLPPIVTLVIGFYFGSK